MFKPKDYDTTTIGGEALTPGGHKCIIKQVDEAISQKGREMLVVSIDTSDEDTQPGYYMNRWLNDSRDPSEKKWGGRMFIMQDGEYATANIKRFCTAVENSNDGFECWKNDQLDLEGLKGQKVGVVFRGEDYTKTDMTVGYTVKGLRFCSYDTAYDQPVPKKKELVQEGPQPFPAPAQTGAAGFVDAVPDGLEDEGLPFK